jgi:hypothetical protein
MYQRSTIDGSRGCEDELGWCGGTTAAGSLEHGTDGIDVDLKPKVKVVFGAARHDTVETVDSIGDAQVGIEQLANLCRVGQISLEGDDMLGASGSFGLDYVGKDESDIGCTWILKELSC